MAKWIRLLSRPADASGQWHILAADKEFAIANALCGERFPGPVEVAPGEERTSREGRCPECETRLAAKQQETIGASR
jgi:hypothetical protein